MIPSTDLRLASMIRAVETVILPALADHSGLAQEQTHMLLGHLHVLRMQADHATAFELAEARSLAALGRELADTAQGGDATEGAGKALADLVAGSEPIRPAEVRAYTTSLSVAVEDLVNASGQDGSDAFKASSAEAILRHGREQSMRDRSWSQATGFENADVELMGFDELTDLVAQEAYPAG